ncbi:MAG: hypothetical protein ABI162_05250 [Luteolibacter sp.]
MVHENLPIPPSPVFQHALRKPASMLLRVDTGSVHIPEQMI